MNSEVSTRIRDVTSPRIACLVLHGSAQPEWSLLNFLEAAESTGYTPVIVYNGALSQQLRSTLEPLARLAERPNFGHDFGAYREIALAMSHRSQQAGNCLVLANDSVFYPNGFSSIFKETSGLASDVTAITASSTPRFHLQSYFVHFNSTAISSSELTGFWERYRLTSVRSRVIRKGEMGLSRTIHNSPLSMRAYVDTRRVAEVWFQLRDSGADPDRLGDLTTPRFRAGLYDPASRHPDHLARVMLNDGTNPTHTFGLVLHELLGVPIKKDLWKSIPPNYLFPKLTGYTKSQLGDIADHMEAQLARYHSHSFVDRADYSVGNC